MQSEWVENPFTHGPCVVCDSPHRILLRHVGATKTRAVVPLFFCLDCHSMSCIGDFVESEAWLRADVKFHARHVDKQLREYWHLAGHLKALTRATQHADIGCGVGALTKAFAASGYLSVGYDVNRFAIERGRQLFPGLDLRDRPAGADGQTYDLMTAIDVLEHIKDPASFMSSIVAALNSGGYLYVVVPRLDRCDWRLLTEPIERQIEGPSAEASWSDNLLRENDVHVVHYSSTGLAALGERFGLKVIADHRGDPWPRNGILYRKPGKRGVLERLFYRDQRHIA